MTWVNPRTWLAGERDAAALLNPQIRDNLKALTEYTAFTPVLTASTTNPTLGTGATAEGGYIHAGFQVFWWFRFIFGTSMAAGSGDYRVGLPPPNPWNSVFPHIMADCRMVDISTGGRLNRSGAVTGASPTFIVMEDEAGGRVTHTSIAWAAGDYIAGKGFYVASAIP